MDVRLSPEQHALRDSAAQLVDRSAPRGVRDLDDGERAAKLDAAVAGAGWRELRTATEDGTPWASGVEVAIVAEELGRGLADAAFIGPTLAAELRRLAGAPPVTGAETIAENGRAVDAAGAERALSLANAHEPPFTGRLVRTRRIAGRRDGVDLTRPDADLAGEAERVGEIDDAQLAQWTALGLAVTCADLVGVMRGATTLACDYASTREQYGVAVGSFQAVQHLLADAHVAMEGSRSVTLYAAWAVDALSPADALVAGSIAKAYCSRAARDVCETAIQVHGGIGNTWDCLAHVYLRRALVSIDLFGGVGPSLDRVLEGHGLR